MTSSAKWNWPDRRIRLGYFDIYALPGTINDIRITNLRTHEELITSREDFREFIEEAIEKYIAENT